MPVPLLNKQTDKQAKICDIICFSFLGKNQTYLFIFVFRKKLSMLSEVYHICKYHPSSFQKGEKMRVRSKGKPEDLF